MRGANRYRVKELLDYVRASHPINNVPGKVRILKDGSSIILDEDDYNALSEFKISAPYKRQGGKRYAVIHLWNEAQGRYRLHRLQRLLMNCPRGKDVDHINRDTLDYRRLNLRVCTSQQNAMNKGKYRNNRSGLKGVYWYESRCEWRSYIKVPGRTIALGRFDDPLSAARAYDAAALKLHGEFACINGIEAKV